MTKARLAGRCFESVDGLNPAIAMPVGSGEVRTNGKIERFHGTLETEVGRHNSPGDFITYRQLTLAFKRRRCPFLLVCLPHHLSRSDGIALLILNRPDRSGLIRRTNTPDRPARRSRGPVPGQIGSLLRQLL